MSSETPDNLGKGRAPDADFGISYLNENLTTITTLIESLGFKVKSAGLENSNPNVVIYRGLKDDGTKISIRMEKASNPNVDR